VTRPRRFITRFSFVGWLFVATCVIGGGPLGYYGIMRLTNTIPSEAVWSSHGGNHGPWAYEWPHFYIMLSMLLLIPLMLLSAGSAVASALKYRLLLVAGACGLIVMQLGLIVGIFVLTSWTFL
jgi:hypothetical protein